MKKKILSICLATVIAVMAIAGASLAYLTDTDEAENTFVIGNVKIEQYEKDRNGNDFVQNQKLLPIVNDKKDANGYHLGGNYIDKIVTVKNTGSEAAYIRTHIAFPAALDNGASTYDASANVLHWNGASANDDFELANTNMDNDWYWGKSTENDWPNNGGDWNCYQAEIKNEEGKMVLYNVYVVTHGTAVEAKATTAPSLFGVYLDAGVNCDENGCYFIMRNGARVDVDMSNTDVLVLSEAVQAAGWDDAFTALDQAFGEVGTYNPWNK